MATSTTTQGTQQSNEALSVLIQQLMNGGTASQQQQSAQRQGEVNANQALRARYSPEAAMADAQGLISQQLRLAMEKSLPSITRSAEGAGASANALRALLTQDALAKAAESSSAVGVQAVQGYGSIGAQISGILEGLTRPDNSGTDALLQALQLQQQGTQTTVNDSQGGGVSSGGTGRAPSSGGSGSNTDSFFYRPGGVLANAAQQRATAPVSYGPALTDSQIIDTIQRGLGPSQSINDVQGVNDLYRGNLRL